MDRELNEEKERAEGQFDSSEDEDESDSEEEEDWKKPSAYSLLIGSLKKNSKQKDFYKKIQREQEGIEEVSASEEELEEGMEDDEELEDEDLEGDEELVDEELEDEDLEEEDSDEDVHEEAEDNDAADPLEEEEEEEEIVYVGSDEEEEIPDDLFEARFADEQPTSFDQKIAVVEQKKWVPQMFHDDVLNEVTAMTTTTDNHIKEMPKIESLEDIKVKQRIANCWPKANKEIVRKGKKSVQIDIG